MDGGQCRNQRDRHGTGDRSRVQIFAAEQFLAEQHASWCSAAPIHDPDSGEVLGTVDPSGPRLTSPRQPSLAPAAADTPESVRRFERTLSEDRPGRADPAQSVPSCSLAAPIPPPAGPASPRGADPRPAGARAEPAALGEPRRRCSPEGLTREQLTPHLYGDNGDRVSTRAAMSRLRKLLGSAWRSRPIASPPTRRRTP